MKHRGNKTTTITTVGFALFAMFFGAGNLILPPYIGLETGNAWLGALSGFFITAIFAPFLGILVVAKSGISIRDLGERAHPKLIDILSLLIILCIGPLVAIPRTGATTFEIGIQPLFPQMNQVAFAIMFFAVVFAMSVSKSKIVDIIGKFLTPFLLVSLMILVVWGVLNPPGDIADRSQTFAAAFSFGFIEGYQTLDVLASVIFAGIIIAAVIENGYSSQKERSKMTIASGVVSMLALLFIYGGLIYLGATSNYPAGEQPSRTEFLLHISKSILGEKGTLVIAVAIAFACLTTAIALTSATGSILENLTKRKLPYKAGVTLCTLISVFLSINGVDTIIKYAVNILLFIYPIVFTLILTVLVFGSWIREKTPYVAAILVTAFVSIFSVLKNLNIGADLIGKYKDYLPLSYYGLEWLLPAFATFAFFVLLKAFQRTR